MHLTKVKEGKEMTPRSSSDKKSVENGVIYSYLAPVVIGTGASIPFVLGASLVTVLASVALIFSGVAWFGWACFARKEIFEEGR